MQYNPSITLIGSARDIQSACDVFDTELILRQCGNEEHDREDIASIISEHKLKAAILYRGNTVWDIDRLVKNVKTIVKHNDMLKMNGYTYKFFSLVCGSIAHYNIHGWIANYPTVDSLRGFFRCNEFGRPVVSHIPFWHSDGRKAATLIEEVLN